MDYFRLIMTFLLLLFLQFCCYVLAYIIVESGVL